MAVSLKTPLRTNLRTPHFSVFTDRWASGVVYDVDAQAFFDTLTTPLDAPVMLAVSNLISGWKNDGFWDIADGIALFDLPTAESRAKNLKNPAQTWTIGAGITYDGINGIYGDGTSAGVVDTSLDGNAIGSGAGFLASHIVVGAAAGLQVAMGNAATRLHISHGKASGSEPRGRINTSSAAQTASVVGADGDYLLCSKSAATTQYLQVNSTLYGPATVTSAMGSAAATLSIYGVTAASAYPTISIDLSAFGNAHVSEAIWNATQTTHSTYKTALAAHYA